MHLDAKYISISVDMAIMNDVIKSKFVNRLYYTGKAGIRQGCHFNILPRGTRSENCTYAHSSELKATRN